MPSYCLQDGQLDSSYFEVRNLQVYGTVKQGPRPNLCSDQPTDDHTDDHTDDKTDDSSGDDDATCVEEADYDYSGYDLSYDDVSSQDECCAGCEATSGCKAWTFSRDMVTHLSNVFGPSAQLIISAPFL